ncbi:Gfo/Idh/MocA family oxidoreductase [Georgenia halophila]
MKTLGVGFVGAGPATQAIHIPTLARLTDSFHVAHVMDVDAEVAKAVADRVGAAHSASLEELLADPSVDVVAICSPPQFHTEQVAAACRAGVRAVLCEKPLATSGQDAARIAEVVRETGVPLVVGAMHTFDPAWQWGFERMDAMPHTVRSRIVLPPNARFEDAATEVIERPEFPKRDLSTPEAEAAFLSGVLFNLVIHDLPLVRRFAPDVDRIEFARGIEPFAYVMRYRSGDTLVDLTGGLSANWRPDWSLEAISPSRSLRVGFTPSYVHAGSAGAEVSTPDGTERMRRDRHNGYEGEWVRLARYARSRTANSTEVQEMVQDLQYTVDLSAAVATKVLEDVR